MNYRNPISASFLASIYFTVIFEGIVEFPTAMAIENLNSTEQQMLAAMFFGTTISFM